MVTPDFPKQIVFKSRNGPTGSSIGIQLGRHWVFKGIVVTTWNRANEAIPSLDFSVPLKVQEIVSDPNWRDKKCGVRIATGRCLKLFATLDVLPIEEANPGKKGPRKYKRK